MALFDGFLSGIRGGLFVRNLILRALNRPRLKVSARVGNVWVGGTEAPLTLMVGVANPSPHPLVLSHIGIEIGKRGDAGFPDELKAILGPLAQFDSRCVSMTVEALQQFIARFAEGLSRAGGARRRDGRAREAVVLADREAPAGLASSHLELC